MCDTCFNCDLKEFCSKWMELQKQQKIDKFLKDNLEKCIGICNAWNLEIKTIEELRQAAEYLLDKI